MIKLLRHLGLYFIMMKKVISTPEKWSVFRKQLVLEMEKVGLNSIGLVIMLSFFMGAVTCFLGCVGFLEEAEDFVACGCFVFVFGC